MSGGGGVGASPNDTYTYPTHMSAYHKQTLNNDGDWTSYINVAEEMWKASSYGNGSPYSDVTPYSPDEALARATERYDALVTAQGAMNAEQDVADDFNQAVTLVDANLATPEAAAIAATQLRMKNRFREKVSRTALSLFFGGAAVNTQFYMTLALMEDELDDQLNEVDQRMSLQSLRDRNEAILRMTDIGNRQFQFHWQSMAQLAGAEFDLAKLQITAKQDEIDAALQWEILDSEWNLHLFAYGNQVLGSITGATSMPRNPTEKERRMAAITTSINTGLQVGTAMGSPGMGALAAILSGVGQMAGGTA